MSEPNKHIRCPLCQAISALRQIQEDAATKPNGGAWAAGIATLCLATLTGVPDVVGGSPPGS